MPHQRRHHICTGICAAGLCLFATGCAASRKNASEVDYNMLSELEFMHDYLANQPVVTVDEAYKAMLIMTEGSDPTSAFAEREARLAEQGIIRTAWGLQAGQYVDKATVAYMVCQATGMIGGINRLLLGSWGPGDRHYALRELKHREIIRGGVDYTYLTGGEFLGILYRADAWMRQAAGQAGRPVPRADDPSTFAQPATQPSH